MKFSYDDIVVATVRWSVLLFHFSYKLLQLCFRGLSYFPQRIQLLAQCKNVVNGPVLISYLPVYNWRQI